MTTELIQNVAIIALIIVVVMQWHQLNEFEDFQMHFDKVITDILNDNVEFVKTIVRGKKK